MVVAIPVLGAAMVDLERESAALVVASVGGYLSAIAAAVATEEEADGVGGRGVVAVDSSCSVFQICPSICRIFSLCFRSQLRPFLSLPKLFHSPQSDETPFLLSSRHSIF